RLRVTVASCAEAMRRGSASAFVVLLLAWAAAATATPAVSLHYDVYYLALRVLSVDVASQVDPTAYRTTVSLRTAGLLHAIVPGGPSAPAAGAIDGAGVRPAYYRVHSEYRRRQQSIDLEYGREGAVRGDVDGMLTDGLRDEVPQALRNDTVDPIT